MAKPVQCIVLVPKVSLERLTLSLSHYVLH